MGNHLGAQAGQYVVVDMSRSSRRRLANAVIIFALGVFAGTVAWHGMPSFAATKQAEPMHERVMVAMLEALAGIAQHLCSGNGGGETIELPPPGSLMHNFECRDGARFRNVTVDFRDEP